MRPFDGKRRMIDNAAVVLPQPLSPARPRLSPSPRLKSMPSTARTVPSCVSKCVLSPFTSRSAIGPRWAAERNPFLPRPLRGNPAGAITVARPAAPTSNRGSSFVRSSGGGDVTELARRVRRFYAYTAASSFALWIPFWTLWIRGNLGSDFEFTLVDVAFWLGMLAFQLPVGVLAYRIGRRRTIVLSETIRSAGILGYGLGWTFAWYVIAKVVWSLGAAFSIGTSAYLYDALLEAGHESEFPRYIGRNTTIQLLSNAAGAFAGGLLVQAVGEIRLTLFVGAALNLAAVAIALTFAEPNVPRTTEPTYAAQLR